MVTGPQSVTLLQVSSQKQKVLWGKGWPCLMTATKKYQKLRCSDMIHWLTTVISCDHNSGLNYSRKLRTSCTELQMSRTCALGNFMQIFFVDSLFSHYRNLWSQHWKDLAMWLWCVGMALMTWGLWSMLMWVSGNSFKDCHLDGNRACLLCVLIGFFY